MESNNAILLLPYFIAIVLVVFALLGIFWKTGPKTKGDDDEPPLGI